MPKRKSALSFPMVLFLSSFLPHLCWVVSDSDPAVLVAFTACPLQRQLPPPPLPPAELGVWLSSLEPPNPPIVDRTLELMPGLGMLCAKRGSCQRPFLLFWQRVTAGLLNQARCINQDTEPLGLSFPLYNNKNSQSCLCTFLLPGKCAEHKVDSIRRDGFWAPK